MSDRLALIIANSEFDDPKLTRLATPSRDAKALAQALRDPSIGGFEVALLVNRTMRDVRQEIARLYRRKKRDDLLLLYYSGHGITDDYGELYLAVKDTEKEIVGATAVDATFVRGQLDRSNSQRKVVILDCCHSGAFARGAKAALGSSVSTQEAFAGTGYGRVILTASNAVQYAWEGNQPLGQAETSVFTHFLVQGIQTGAADLDADGLISLDELYDYVYKQVVTSGAKQTPQKWTQEVQGDIIIARNPRPVIKPAELPPELRQAVESPFAGVREGAVRDLDHLLRGSDKGFALAAQEALERLLDDDSRRVSVAAARALRVSPRPVAHKRSPTPASPTISEPVEPRRRPVSRNWIVGAGLAALAALALIVTVILLSTIGGGDGKTVSLRPTDTPSPTNTATSQPTDTVPPQPTGTSPPTDTATPPPTDAPALGVGSTKTRETDGALMVYVPGGTFQMGSDDGDSDEQPVHDVTLDSFWIDKYEVTNAQFAAFLNEQGNQTEGEVIWLDLEDEDCLIEQVDGEYQSKSGYADHPVIEVSWYGANAYCEWVGARLPTEAEWEYAARGPDGNIYPWGNGFDCSLGNFDGEGCDGYKRTAPVGSFEGGASWCRALDMTGNVWEWVSDWYGEYPSAPQTDPTGPETGDYRVLRGGSWNTIASYVRSANRNGNLPHSRYENRGFRCVGAPTSSLP